MSPWHALPERPDYVLEVDRPYVDAFNRVLGGDERFRLNLALIPEPFLGPRDAPLVLLLRNPGIGTGDERVHTTNRAYRAALRANLGDDPGGHYLVGLLPEFADTPSGAWWARKCMRAVIDEGIPPRELSQRVLAVEFHGYHSSAWKPIPITLPSQRYGFSLVQQAIDRGAHIVLMRGCSDWEIAVPGLMDYEHVTHTRTARSSTISPGNCGREAFDAIVDAVSA